MQIKRILENIKQVKVAVYGDFCLDAYWVLDPKGSEVSIETGQQAKAISNHYYSPGGAGNVVMNLVALKPKSIEAIGVIGDDIYGRELKSQLRVHHVKTDNLFTQAKDFQTYTYVKCIENEKEISRHDFGVNNIRHEETDQKIIHAIDEALQRNDVLIFNQQIDGALSTKFITNVNKVFEKHSDKTILLDSRHYTNQFKNVSFKLNDIELFKLAGKSINYREEVPLSEVKSCGKKIFDESRIPLFITCGARGILVIDGKGIRHANALKVNEEIDTVGAGDTCLSTIALCLATQCSHLEAIQMANLAAAVSIRKLLTTGTASGDEIIAMSIRKKQSFV